MSSLTQAQPSSYFQRGEPILYRVIEPSLFIMRPKNKWDATQIYSPQQTLSQTIWGDALGDNLFLVSKFSNYDRNPNILILSADSMVELGVLYELGVFYASGTDEQDSIAVFWYQKAATLGHPEGQTRLGWRYQQGKAIAKNDSMAYFWYQKAANQGDPDAQSHLGWLYEYGKGVAQNDLMAVFWYQKAADIGHDEARNRLGWMYEQGKGVSQDFQKALYWYQEAASQNNLNALVHLGQLYETGKGISRNKVMAFEYYSDAATQGDAVAQNLLGQWYETSLSNLERAVYWYETAAHQDNAAAQKNLSRLYRLGKGVPKEPISADFWLKKADNHQDTLFKNQGQEVSCNTEVYLNYMKAASGDSIGMISLAHRYAFGEGVLKNDSAAHYWYQKMKDKGYTQGQIALDTFHQTSKWKNISQFHYFPSFSLDFQNHVKQSCIKQVWRKFIPSKRFIRRIKRWRKRF